MSNRYGNSKLYPLASRAEEVTAAIMAGEPLADIAERFGSAYSSVLSFCAAQGIERPEPDRRSRAQVSAGGSRKKPHFRAVSKSWGKWLTGARRDARMTRRDLARASGVDPSSVTLYERGNIPPPKVVEKIGNALGGNRAMVRDMALVQAGYLPEEYKGLILTALGVGEGV